jgi:hypothetical protein
MADDAPAGAKPRTKLAELAVLFLRLGFTAFGGPAAPETTAARDPGGAASLLEGLGGTLGGTYVLRSMRARA